MPTIVVTLCIRLDTSGHGMIVSWCCAHCLICEEDFPLMGIVDSRNSPNIDPLLVGKFNRSRSLLHEKSGSAQEVLATLPLVENVPE